MPSLKIVGIASACGSRSPGHNSELANLLVHQHGTLVQGFKVIGMGLFSGRL